MSNREKIYHVYLIDKNTNTETYLSSHKRSKDAERHGNRVVNQKSPKKFGCVVKHY